MTSILTGSDGSQRVYDPPRVEEIGSLYELTQSFCIFNKTLGSPDYWSRIPIANCSS